MASSNVLGPGGGLRNSLVVDPERLRDPTVAEAQALDVRDFRDYSLIQRGLRRHQAERQNDLGHGSNALRPCPPSGGIRQRVPPGPYDSPVTSRSAAALPGFAGTFDPSRLAETCRRWKIAELDLFGSVARGEAGPKSDVDLLVTFLPGTDWGLLDHVAMEQDLTEVFGHRVDLVTRRAVERSGNALRRGEILAAARPIYVS